MDIGFPMAKPLLISWHISRDLAVENLSSDGLLPHHLVTTSSNSTSYKFVNWRDPHHTVILYDIYPHFCPTKKLHHWQKASHWSTASQNIKKENRQRQDSNLRSRRNIISNIVSSDAPSPLGHVAFRIYISAIICVYQGSDSQEYRSVKFPMAREPEHLLQAMFS